MGFYIRKSVRLGPVRFNLSKSGIGASVGVTGLRIGSSPRGNYVHMGRGGFYYRALLPSSRTRPPDFSASPPAPSPEKAQRLDALTEIESGSVLNMVEGSSEGLIAELNEKQKKWRLWPWLLAASVLGIPQLTNFGVSEALWPVLMLIGLVATLVVAHLDTLRRTTVLFYDMEPDAERRYQMLHDACDAFAACNGTWHLEAAGATRDQKRNAGASTLVRRKTIRLSKQPPTTLRTNIDVPTIPAGRQTLVFLPDRLLVFDRDGVGAVAYDSVSVEVASSRFIEEGPVPSDATVVGQTWRYVNKKGGPDKRFKDNRQLPICMYESMLLKSLSGLNEAFQLSSTGAGDLLRKAVRTQIATTVGETSVPNVPAREPLTQSNQS